MNIFVEGSSVGALLATPAILGNLLADKISINKFLLYSQAHVIG